MFSVKNLQINRGRTTAAAQGKDTSVIHTYIDEESTVANIRLYFPPFLDQGESQDDILLTDYMFVTGSDTAIMAKILSLDPFSLDVDLFSGAAGLSVGSPIPPVDGNAAKITLGILQMEIADQTHPGIMSAAPQTFGGEKTFTANVNIVDPPQGLTITKTMGNMGVELLTSDPTAFAGYAIESTAFPNESYGIVYRQNGISGVTPEVGIIVGDDLGMVFNKADQGAFVNYKLFSNTLDSESGSPLDIGTVNATVINLGTNTTLPFDKELLVNQIDSVTAAPLIIGVTNTTEIIFGQGIKLPTLGGLQSNLADYEVFDLITAFTNNTETSAPVTVRVLHLGDFITLSVRSTVSVPGQVAPGALFSSDTALPARFRPAIACNGYFRVSNNGVFSSGAIEVTSAGVINIYHNSDFTTAFTAAVANGFSTGVFTYPFN